jgi:hypothetical protein
MKHDGVIVLVDRWQFTSTGDTYERAPGHTRVFVCRSEENSQKLILAGVFRCAFLYRLDRCWPHRPGLQHRHLQTPVFSD